MTQNMNKQILRRDMGVTTAWGQILANNLADSDKSVIFAE